MSEDLGIDWRYDDRCPFCDATAPFENDASDVVEHAVFYCTEFEDVSE